VDFTNHGAAQTLRWVLGQTPGTPPPAFYVQLHIGDPGPDGTQNVAGESLRVEYVPDAINDAGGATGEADVVNTGDINWTSLAATETLTHVSIWDDISAGDCWYKGDLVAPVQVVAGGNFQFLDQNGLIRHD